MKKSLSLTLISLISQNIYSMHRVNISRLSAVRTMTRPTFGSNLRFYSKPAARMILFEKAIECAQHKKTLLKMIREFDSLTHSLGLSKKDKLDILKGRYISYEEDDYSKEHKEAEEKNSKLNQDKSVVDFGIDWGSCGMQPFVYDSNLRHLSKSKQVLPITLFKQAMAINEHRIKTVEMQANFDSLANESKLGTIDKHRILTGCYIKKLPEAEKNNYSEEDKKVEEEIHRLEEENDRI